MIEDKIEVYFGEVLGKHSEIYGAIEENEIIFVSDSLEAIKVILEHNLENGYNPFEYRAFNNHDEGMEDATIGEIIEKRLQTV